MALHGTSDSMKKVLYLHRNDLRFHDNPVLSTVSKEDCVLLPVYIFDPKEYGQFALSKINRAGRFKRKFIFDSVAVLSKKYREHGSTLITEHGSTIVSINAMLRKYSINDVFMVKEHTEYEIKIENELVKANPDVEFRFFEDRTMLHPDDLPFHYSVLPELFTTFRKEVEKDLRVRKSADAVVKLPPTIDVQGEGKNLEEIAVLLGIEKGLELRFKGGESEGQRRLKYYLDETQFLSRYKETRNGLLGDDYSSKFSPWLSIGALSPRQIFWAVKEYEEKHGANDSTYWLIFELLWRDFFRFVAMKHGRKIFMKNGIRGGDAPGRSEINMKRFNKWCRGETGQPFIDANMRELNATGFMSNRGRQNVASYLVHDLGLDWRLGAEYFESMLLDYDPCSNWGNWMYLAGVGNDGRDFRRFNPERQAAMYDPEGEYQKHWRREM